MTCTSSTCRSAAFNLFRFGSPVNTRYLLEASWGPPLGMQVEHLAAPWMAPGTDMPKRALLYPALLALGCLGLRRSARAPQSNL